MVGGDGVDEVHVLPQRCLVVPADQAGPDLSPARAPDPMHVILAHEQMVGAHFASDLHACKRTLQCKASQQTSPSLFRVTVNSSLNCFV